MDSTIQLGKKYRYLITGIEGVATAVATYADGSVMVLLEWESQGDSKSAWVSVAHVGLVVDE